MLLIWRRSRTYFSIADGAADATFRPMRSCFSAWKEILRFDANDSETRAMVRNVKFGLALLPPQNQSAAAD
ncbi:MAG: hypothetical protein DME43_07995 [Verrucomicrobia bacterium]|nr:MAG: hypothetical protein DME43_07995 [Verrucomicrobiota bacterium]